MPPHLRNGGSAGAAPPDTRGSSSFGSYGRRGDGARDAGGSRDYGSSFGSRDSGRSDGARRPESLPSSNGRAAKPAATDTSANFPDWQPSKRALAMSEQQITEARERLNITVEGEASPTVPLEAFDDMVRSKAYDQLLGTPTITISVHRQLPSETIFAHCYLQAPCLIKCLFLQNLHENIMRDITYKQYDKPTPIQAQGVPLALKGKDVLGCAETGSGKTASFGIPMIQHCLHQAPLRRGDGPMGLVLAPTRELAQQIEREIKDFSRTSRDVRTAIVVGGTNISEQRSELRNGVEIVIATPGRFIDHLQQNNTSLNRVSYVVLDEADRMLDMGFEPQIKDIMQNLPTPHQTLLFSATMPEEIETLAGQYLSQPVRIKVPASHCCTFIVSLAAF